MRSISGCSLIYKQTISQEIDIIKIIWLSKIIKIKLEIIRQGAKTPVKCTIFIFDAALIRAITAWFRLELNVAELQHSCYQLQHRLHLVFHETHDLHGILREQNNTQTQVRSADVNKSEFAKETQAMNSF